MNYNDLTIHQKISLKDIICNRKTRNQIGLYKDDTYWDGLHCLAIINRSFVKSINIFLES